MHCHAQQAFREVDCDNRPCAQAYGRLLDMIETGEVRYKDETRIWIAKHYGDRSDNLICGAPHIRFYVVLFVM